MDNNEKDYKYQPYDEAEIIEVLNEELKTTLPYASWRVLGAMLLYTYTSHLAIDGRLILSNSALRTLAGVGSSNLASACLILELYGLIDRYAGASRTKGNKPQASEYVIHFDRLDQPLKKMSMMELHEKKSQSLVSKPKEDVASLEKEVFYLTTSSMNV